MCIHCIEIQQGKYKTYEEFAEVFEPGADDFDLDHYFSELSPIVDSLKYKRKDPGACSCGAKHTSFPKHHLRYCNETKD